jgi:hypothetical protein
VRRSLSANAAWEEGALREEMLVFKLGLVSPLSVAWPSPWSSDRADVRFWRDFGVCYRKALKAALGPDAAVQSPRSGFASCDPFVTNSDWV